MIRNSTIAKEITWWEEGRENMSREVRAHPLELRCAAGKSVLVRAIKQLETASQSLSLNMGSGHGYTQIWSDDVSDPEGSMTVPSGLYLSG